MNETKPKHQEIMEEEKTTESHYNNPSIVPILGNPPGKKTKKAVLNINTEAINEMYTFGGENGQQIIISED